MPDDVTAEPTEPNDIAVTWEDYPYTKKKVYSTDSAIHTGPSRRTQLCPASEVSRGGGGVITAVNFTRLVFFETEWSRVGAFKSKGKKMCLTLTFELSSMISEPISRLTLMPGI